MSTSRVLRSLPVRAAVVALLAVSAVVAVVSTAAFLLRRGPAAPDAGARPATGSEVALGVGVLVVGVAAVWAVGMAVGAARRRSGRGAVDAAG